jgi:hypothetical protein
MIVTEQDDINSWKLMQVKSRIGPPYSGNLGSQMHMIASVQEVRISHQSNSFPLEDRRGVADEEN